MRRRSWGLLVGIAILLALAMLPIAVGAQTSALRVQGVTLVNDTGQRFVFAGINMEMYRDYDNGCGWVTDQTYKFRTFMADKVKSLGVNAVRLNYAYRFLNRTGNLTRFLDMAQELAKRGMYVMPSDHTYTGKNAPSNTSDPSYAMMRQIVEGARARGFEDRLIMNPWNEIGPDMSASAWIVAQKAVIGYLRSTVGYKGVIVLDGTGWSTMLGDLTAFKEVLKTDSNVVFSHHLYPNITGLPSQLWTAAKQVPLIVGELGQENPGASPLDPNYVKSTISGFLNTGMPNGHNGLFAWSFAWCDQNTMLQDTWKNPATGEDWNTPYSDASPLTSHGVLWRDNYYAKLPAQPPVVTPVVATDTAIPATSRPSATPTVRATSTHLASPTRTATPTADVLESYHIIGRIGGMDVDIMIERVR